MIPPPIPSIRRPGRTLHLPQVQRLLAQVEEQHRTGPLREESVSFIVGADAQSLKTETSDTDTLTIYAPLRALLWAVKTPPENLRNADEGSVLVRVDTFARNLHAGNTDAIDLALRGPDHRLSARRGSGQGAQFIGDLMTAVAPVAIHQNLLITMQKHFAGVLKNLRKRASTREKARSEGAGKRAALNDKFLMHGGRLGLMCIHAASTGTLLVDFAEHPARAEMYAIKTQQRSLDEITAWLGTIEEKLRDVLTPGVLASFPDPDTVASVIDAHFSQLPDYLLTSDVHQNAGHPEH